MKMVIREIDEQGRIVIPYEWRTEEGLLPKTKVELTKEGGRILIKPLKYRSLMELKGVAKGKMTLKEIENAEMYAANKRLTRSR